MIEDSLSARKRGLGSRGSTSTKKNLPRGTEAGFGLGWQGDSSGIAFIDRMGEPAGTCEEADYYQMFKLFTITKEVSDFHHQKKVVSHFLTNYLSLSNPNLGTWP